MKERSILFSGPMVRAILDGRKTQTRRVVKAMSARQAEWLTPALIDSVVALDVGRWECGFGVSLEHPGGGPLGFVRCPFGAPGDRLWVRETWAQSSRGLVIYRAAPKLLREVEESEGGWVSAPKWRPSIYMPRWASRVTLEVTEVRVERLQAISEADARAEGVERIQERIIMPGSVPPETIELTHRHYFRLLWESIHSAESWASNPWVWVVSFRRLA